MSKQTKTNLSRTNNMKNLSNDSKTNVNINSSISNLESTNLESANLSTSLKSSPTNAMRNLGNPPKTTYNTSSSGSLSSNIPTYTVSIKNEIKNDSNIINVNNDSNDSNDNNETNITKNAKEVKELPNKSSLRIKELLSQFELELVNSKKNKSNLELEVSFQKINKDIFMNLFNDMLGDPSFKFLSITRSLDTIAENLYNDAKSTTHMNYRREIKFTTHGKASDSYMKKTSLLKRPLLIEDFINYKLKLSSEEPISAFVAPVNALLRFKIRASFMHKDYPNWRFDLTMIKSGLLNELGDSLQKLKNELLTADFNEKNIFDVLPLHEITNWEVEIEWIGKEGNSQNSAQLIPTEKDLEIVLKVFNLIDKEAMSKMKYQKYIYQIAKDMEVNSYKLNKFKTDWGLKELSNQVIGLTKQTYKEIYPPIGYYITEKTDGYRAFVYVRDNKLVILWKNEVFEKDFGSIASKLGRATLSETATIITETSYSSDTSIVDAEIVIGDGNGDEDANGDKEVLLTEDSNFTIKIFDVIMFRDEHVGELTGRQRLVMLDDVVLYLNKIMPKFVKKEFSLITSENLNTIFETTYKKSTESEGLIIMSGTSTYAKTKNYKWKNFDRNTIDFLAKSLPTGVLGNSPFMKREGYELYVLFTGISIGMKHYMGLKQLSFYDKLFSKEITHAMYQPIHFTPSTYSLAYLYYHKLPKVNKNKKYSNNNDNNNNNNNNSNTLDNKIIELRIAKPLVDNNEKNSLHIDYTQPLNWELVKIREDRKQSSMYFGNNFETAEITFQNYFSPFDIKSLSNPDFGYFRDAKSNIYEASNKFKRMIGTEIIEKNAIDMQWVLDLGSGRGGDIQRYQVNKVKNVIMIDIDNDAINEIIARKYDTAKGDKVVVKGNVVSSSDIATTIYTIIADLNNPYMETTKAINNITGTVSPLMTFVMFNFSFHYFASSEDKLTNILKLLNAEVAPNGMIVITIMNGQKIFDKLKDIPLGSYYTITELIDNEKIEKYSIRKNYKGDELSQFGQSISVKMPFSQEHYDETLMNIPVIIEHFKKYDFDLYEEFPFNARLASFKRQYKNQTLTEQDLEYIDLHHVLIFRKKKETKTKSKGK